MKIDTLTDAQLVEALAEADHEDIARALADKVTSNDAPAATPAQAAAPAADKSGMDALIRRAAGHS